MRQLQFLVKPASGFCNMRYQYCFYQDELQNRICPDSSMMSEDTAEMMIRQRFAEIDPCGSPSFALSFYLCPAQNVRNRPNSTDTYQKLNSPRCSFLFYPKFRFSMVTAYSLICWSFRSHFLNLSRGWLYLVQHGSQTAPLWVGWRCSRHRFSYWQPHSGFPPSPWR